MGALPFHREATATACAENEKGQGGLRFIS